MAPLHLPPDATTTLKRAWHGEGDASELDKWLIYTTASVPASNAQDLFYRAMEGYQEGCIGPDEWEELGFVKTATTTHWPDLQSVLEHHLGMVRRRFPDEERVESDDVQFYCFGFIALTRPDWRERDGGVTAVHCDFDRGRWKVTQCSGIPIDQLGLQLSSVSDVDTEFDRVREEYAGDADDNSGPDNVGGPAPVGEWQFAVFCVGIWRSRVEDLIPDPRGVRAFNGAMGEECLAFLPAVENGWAMDEVKGEWPVAYAKAIKDPTIPANGQLNICKRHPELFVVVEGGEDGPSVKIVEMKWDRGVERSDEQLRRVGKESEVHIRDCEPDEVVSTLEKLARGEQVEA